MPSKISHEIDKIRGETEDTGEIFTASMRDLQDDIDQINADIKELEASETDHSVKITAAMGKASKALSNALNSIKKSGDTMTGDLNMGSHSLRDVQAFYHYGTNNITFFYEDTMPFVVSYDGNVTLTGTVDGRDVAVDGTKLDTIATSADVTGSNTPQAHAASHTDGGSDIVTASRIRTTAQGSPANDDMYFNATSNRLYIRKAGGWCYSDVFTCE